MSSRRPGLLTSLVCLALIAAACSRSGSQASRSELEETSTTTASTATTETSSTPVAELDWQDCGGGRQCATVPAPLDYDDPDGETIDIGVARRPATGDRIGALFVNFGGPGAPAADSIVRGLPVPDAVAERFDIVGVDPRGVGQSVPLACGIPTDELYGADPTIEDDGDRTELVDVSRRYVDDCAATAEHLLPHLGTRDVARDMDLVRQAMGDEQISYLGYSYGTSIGQVYAEQFPDRVRSMVLDGIVDTGPTGIEAATNQAQGFELALTNWAADCASRGCPFDDPVAAVEAVIASAETGIPAGSDTLGPGEVATALAFPFYVEDFWPLLDQAIADAIDGDGTAMLRLADQYTGLANFSVYFAVSCLDSAWPTDPDRFFAEGKAAEDVAPHLGEAIVLDYIRCAYWPTPPDPIGPITADGAPPILVVSTTGDPATPHHNGITVADRLASGVLVTHEGEGHAVVYRNRSDCIDDVVTDYLLDGQVPADGIVC